MTTTATRPIRETIYEQGPATAALSDKVHDLIQCLNIKLDSVWRYDKYLEDCGEDNACKDLFSRLKEDDVRACQLLRDEIERLCREGSFR